MHDAHAVHLALGGLLIPCATCGTGCLTPSLAALAAQEGASDSAGYDGQRGFCFVRGVQDGEVVLTSYGRASGFCIDPIEKKVARTS